MPKKFVPDTMHLRHAQLLYYNSGLSAVDAHRQLQVVYGEGTVSYRTVADRFARFKEGDYNLEDSERSGRPVEVDLEALRDVVEADPSVTTRKMSEALGVSHATILIGLNKIGKVQKLGRWIPHDLSSADRSRRVEACTSLLSLQRRRPFLRDLVTGDEKWLLYNNTVRRPQWVDRDKRPDPVPKPNLHPRKVMLCCWWSRRGMEYWELLPSGTAITADIYCAQLRKLKSHLDRTRGQDAIIPFQQDNARPHVAKTTRSELLEYGWLVIPHPPYSPDLSSSDYWLFSHLQRHLEGKRFKKESDLEADLKVFFASQPSEFWEKGIDLLRTRWQEVINADGAYL